MESKCPDEILRMRGMNLNLGIMRMLEDTFPLDAAHIYSQPSLYRHSGAASMWLSCLVALKIWIDR